MRFLKTLFWFLLAFVLALFVLTNWTMVPVRIGRITADVNLPLLLVATFLLGLLPTLLYHHAVRWRLRGRLTAAERALEEFRTPVVPTIPLAPGDIPAPPPPGFTPTPMVLSAEPHA